MLKQVRILLAGAVFALAAAPVSAGPEADITAALKKVLPEYEITGVEETPVKGLYEVMMGPQVMYVSSDGRYMMQGRLVDLVKREDLTEPRRAEARRQAVEQVGEDQMVIFAPEKYDHTVTVFTDIDCGYCRKLHSEIADYEDEGIRVRYVFFPRAGVNSKSFKEAVSVWCADDRQQAMTDAKAGRPVAEKSCDNPVKSHMELGELLGINGTPAIVLDSGDLVPGYVPPKRLAALLKGNQR
jgi:thiol:disulfide interchange protein DsbC